MFDPADLDNYDHGPHDYDDSEVARLEAEDELPAWHGRPTGPGLWMDKYDVTWELTEQEVNDHDEERDGRVFGPIPTDPKGT